MNVSRHVLSLIAALLSSCITTHPIPDRQQTFTRPVVIAVVGTEARIQSMMSQVLSGPAYFPKVPEWQLDQTLETAAVQRLRSRGIQARAGGDALRSRVYAIAGYKPGNALELRGINELKIDDALKQLAITDADSVLFLTDGVQPLPVGALRLLSGYGMCQVNAMNPALGSHIDCTFVFAPVRAHAYSLATGKRLGAAIQKKGGLHSLPSGQMPFVTPWGQMPSVQKSRLKKEVEACALKCLDDVIVGLGL
jgi:hypothetical protein